MATLLFPTLPADFLNFEIGRYATAILRVDGAVSATATEIKAISSTRGQTINVEIDGTFTYGSLATVSGTVTSITVSVGTTNVMTITDLSEDAGTAWVAMTGNRNPLSVILGGNDTITGTAGEDRLFGGGGNDVIKGLDGYNILYGDAGNDRLIGGDSYDSLHGGLGNDTLSGLAGGDFLTGGGGRDKLNGHKGRDSLFGDNGNDKLYGGTGSDYLSGGNGTDMLDGGAGNDNLLGESGADVLDGGDGNDHLSGAKGDDSLTGGAGDDVFVFQRFHKAGKSGSDTIHDLEATDTIGLAIGYGGTASDVTIAQVGADVTISMADNMITVIDATLAEVQAVVDIQLYNWYY